MRSKLGPALVAFVVALFVALGVAAAPPSDFRLHTDTRNRRIAMQLERLSADLGLTEDQKTKIKPLIESRINQVRQLRTDESLTEEQREEQLLTIQQSFGTQLHAVLTPEQQKRFAEVKEARAHNTMALRRKGRIPVEGE